MKTGSSLAIEAKLAAKNARENGLTQASIASAVGASQSQVSRILSGASSRRSRLFVEVCKYAREHRAKRPRQTLCVELTSALDDVWDGTTRHAEALALVIRSLGALGSASPLRQQHLGGDRVAE